MDNVTVRRLIGRLAPVSGAAAASSRAELVLESSEHAELFRAMREAERSGQVRGAAGGAVSHWSWNEGALSLGLTSLQKFKSLPRRWRLTCYDYGQDPIALASYRASGSSMPFGDWIWTEEAERYSNEKLAG